MYTDFFDSPIGYLTVGADERYLLFAAFGKPEINKNPNSVTEKAKTQILEYLDGKRKSFTLEYKITGTDFQKRVLSALSAVPYGKTASYKEIAEEAGSPSAFRAVGSACNKNKLPIIIPCHRIIGSDGSLTGYAGGLEIKQYLLETEKCSCQ